VNFAYGEYAALLLKRHTKERIRGLYVSGVDHSFVVSITITYLDDLQ